MCRAPLNYAGPKTPRAVAPVSPWVTTVGILVLLGVFGRLAAKVLLSDREHRDVSNLAAVKTDLEAFDKALGRFQTDMGRLPTHTEGLNALVAQPLEAEAWSGTRPRGTKRYTILSVGPDGVEGTPDDIVNK